MKTVPFFKFGLFVLSSVLLVLQIADTQIMILFREAPDLSVKLVGYCLSASGAGMLIMSAFISKKEIHSIHTFLTIGTIGIGAGFSLVVVIIDLPVFILNFVIPLIFLFVGIAAAAVFVSFNVFAQKSTPVYMSGRIFGTINSITNGASVIGTVLGGILVEAMGVMIAYVLSGCLLILIGISVPLVKKVLKGSLTIAESKRRLQRKT